MVAILVVSNWVLHPLANSRQVALQILLQVVVQGKSLDAVFESDWYQGLVMQDRDLAFARELANGVCRWYFLLKKITTTYLKKPLRNKDQDIELIVLLGIYQLLVLQTDEHAAVNETVQLAVKRKKSWARGMVNGVLRNVIRSGEKLVNYDDALSYADWMQDMIRNDWGDQAASVLSAGNQRAPMTLRFDSSRLTAEEAIHRLAAAGIESSRHEQVNSAVVLERPVAVKQIPGFETGLFSVQDAAAQLAAPLLSVHPGARVLDACAAPGGKGLHLKQLVGDIELDLLDVSEPRLSRVSDNFARAGLQARLLLGDASQPDSWWSEQAYDYILADVPCSGSGVIRRHPDIKLHRKRQDVLRLCDSQRKILRALWSILKPGGSMLYSTCSIFTDENESQVLAFMNEHSDCREIPLDNCQWGQRCEAGYRITPGSHGMDGFFYARLQKMN